jgi:membrane fusion protein
LFFGEYSKTVAVRGIVSTDSGVIRVVSPTSGLIVRRHVNEGDYVEQGALLFSISTDRLTGNIDGLTASGSATLETVRARKAGLAKESQINSELYAEQKKALIGRMASIRTELSGLDAELETMARRVESAREQLNFFAELVALRFYSERALQQKKDELLDQTLRHQAMLRTKVTLTRDLAASETELSQLRARAAKEEGQLGRLMAELTSTGISVETQRQVLVVAPISGIATSVMVSVGDQVSSQPLLAIIPAGALFEAQLYVPSKSIAAVTAKQPVRLKISSLPFQKFGHIRGVVKTVSRAGLSSAELPPLISSSVSAAENETYFRVTVLLRDQYVSFDGQQYPLVSGSPVDASIKGERRRLIQWVLAPISKILDATSQAAE